MSLGDGLRVFAFEVGFVRLGQRADRVFVVGTARLVAARDDRVVAVASGASSENGTDASSVGA